MTAQPLYTVDILRLAATLEEPRALDREHGRSEARSPTCGSRIVTIVQLDEGRVAALSQEVSACAFGQAAAALVERNAIGRSRAEVEAALERAGDWLSGGANEPGWGLEVLAPARSRTGRHGAILLPFRALIGAIDDAA